MRLTHSELIAKFTAEIHGTTALTVFMDSPQTPLKSCPLTVNRTVVKRLSLNGIVGYIYANAVNRLASKEGKEERETKAHPWGDLDAKRIFRTSRSKGEKYLSIKVTSNDVEGYFFADGEREKLNDDQLEMLLAYLPKKSSKSSTQADLDGEVIARDMKLDNIEKIHYRGEVLELIHGGEEETEEERETQEA